jgi:hypothetical protein
MTNLYKITTAHTLTITDMQQKNLCSLAAYLTYFIKHYRKN